MPEFLLIAMDGPGGVGKSSTGRTLAARVGCFFLSSGRIYRAMAWYALNRAGWDGATPLSPAVLRALAGMRIDVDQSGGLSVDGTAVDGFLGSDAISGATSRLSTDGRVRELSNHVQRSTVDAIRAAGRYAGVILEGRDIGTVVYPQARHKFFLTAALEVRARRRYDELQAAGSDQTLEAVTRALAERDQRDQAREEAPLRAAEDALVVDTSALTLTQVVDTLALSLEANTAPRSG